MKQRDSDDEYSPAEAARRRDAIVRNMIATPPARHLSLKAKKKASRRKRATAKAKKSA